MALAQPIPVPTELLHGCTQKIRVRVMTANWQIEGDLYVSLRGKESRALTNLLQQAPNFLPLTDVTLTRIDNPSEVKKSGFLEVHTKLVEWVEPLDPA